MTDDVALGQAGSRPRRPARIVLRWLVALGCAGYIGWFFFRHRQDLDLIVHVSSRSLLWLVGLTLVYNLINSCRYQIILEKVSGAKIPFSPWFKLFILALWLNVFFPQLGNLYRGVQLKNRYGVSYTHYISSYASFAWMDTCLNLTIALLVVLTFGGSLPRRQEVIAAVAILLAVVIVAPLLLAWGLGRFRFQDGMLGWMHTRTQAAVEASAQALRDGRYLLKIFLTSLAVFATVSAIFYVCFLNLGVQVGLAPVGMFCSLYKLSTYVSITPGNLGLQELACGILGAQVQTGGMAPGILASVMVRAVSYPVLAVLAISMGGIGLLRGRSRYQHPHDLP